MWETTCYLTCCIFYFLCVLLMQTWFTVNDWPSCQANKKVPVQFLHFSVRFLRLTKERPSTSVLQVQKQYSKEKTYDFAESDNRVCIIK